MDAFIDFMLSKLLMPGFVILAAVLLFVGVPVVALSAYIDSKSPSFSLRKDQWSCSASVERSTTTYVQSGKVMVPVTNYYNHCVQWTEQP